MMKHLVNWQKSVYIQPMPTIDSIAVSVLKLFSIKMPPIFFGV
jgi:hypothetical protein